MSRTSDAGNVGASHWSECRQPTNGGGRGRKPVRHDGQVVAANGPIIASESSRKYHTSHEVHVMLACFSLWRKELVNNKAGI